MPISKNGYRLKMDSLKEKTIKGIFWVGSTQFVAQVISWAITIFVARFLSPSDYGLMGMAMIFIGFAQFLNELGIGTALIQKQNLQRIEIDSLFWLVVLNSLFLYSITFLSAPLIAQFFNAPRLISILRVLGLNFLLGALIAIPFALLTKELTFDKRCRAELFSNILSSVTVLILALLKFGVWSLVFGSLSRNFLLILFLNYYSKWIPKLCFSIKKVIELLKFGANVTGSRVFWYLYSNSDYFIVGKVLGEKILGFYSLAFQLSSIPINKIASIINPVALPTFSKLQNEEKELKRYFLKFTRGVSFITFPALIGLMFIADEFVNIVLTKKWAPIIFPLRLLCLVGLIKSMAFLIPPLLNARGKAYLNLRYSLLCFLILPPAFLIGSKFGLKGVVLAWVIGYPFVASYIFYLGLKEIHLSLSEYINNMIHIIISVMVMLLVLLIFKHTCAHILNNWLRLFGYIFLGALSYLSTLSIFFPIVKKDITAFLVFKTNMRQ